MSILFVIVPALAVLIWIGIEMPRNWRKAFFRIPVFLSSSVISLLIGTLCAGVSGPLSGFAAEIILFPGFVLIRWTTHRKSKTCDKHK